MFKTQHEKDNVCIGSVAAPRAGGDDRWSPEVSRRWSADSPSARCALTAGIR